MFTRQPVSKFSYSQALRAAYKSMRKTYDHNHCQDMLLDWFSDSVLTKETILAIIERELRATESTKDSSIL